MDENEPFHVTREMKASFVSTNWPEKYEIDPPQQLEAGKWYRAELDAEAKTARMVEVDPPYIRPTFRRPFSQPPCFRR